MSSVKNQSKSAITAPNSESTERFKKVQAQNIAAAKKTIENYLSSSEDEEELDEKSILSSLYKHYNSNNEDPQLLNKTANFLENVLQSGAATCLICIGSVRRADSIWSCKHCFCFFHLNCVRRWATDSLAQQKTQRNQQRDQGHYNHLGEFVPPKRIRPLHWCCPQCREEYADAIPTKYECFCGKELNPSLQPWLVPHSCGEICGKRLLPECGHTCMLLCHPGPCPPCAQYAVISCLCGKMPAKSVRCTGKQWQCPERCTKRLACGEHRCNAICHKSGLCPPCSSTSMQKCECKSEVKERNCSDLKWQCQKECGLKYSCGLHACKTVCHSGPCGDCPLGMPRSCPCGKTKKVGPCTEAVEVCGNTCQKLLLCGVHTCTHLCHRGDCAQCFVIIQKKCRCGRHTKDVPCSKVFTCDIKCKQSRDCGKHACNRKCCDGQSCPPCDKVCGKSLSCNKHKCQSVCHEGPCYPCERQSQVNCRCGKTSKLVPCGRERTVRIMCPEPCRIASKCHHSSNHRCHKNDCPPCNQICGLMNETTACEHLCAAKCHSAVKFQVKSDCTVASGTWDRKKKFEYKNLPHPPCERKVLVACIGGHEIAEWPCWNSKPTSCHRRCGRALNCGNHKCDLICHLVSDPSDMKEQQGCASCQEGCNFPRSFGCTHLCPRKCHVAPCSPCQVNIKAKCHCGLTQLFYKCSEFYDDSVSDTNEYVQRKEQLQSCGNRCLKNFNCGHRCISKCHSGECPNPDSCRKKVRIFCECKRLKAEVSCDKHRNGLQALLCDSNCSETRAQLEDIQKQEAEKIRQQEEAKNRLEVEQFEKKFSKRKQRNRKVNNEETRQNINWRILSTYAGITIAFAAAIVLAFYEEN